jgi:hypothetical protein
MRHQHEQRGLKATAAALPHIRVKMSFITRYYKRPRKCSDRPPEVFAQRVSGSTWRKFSDGLRMRSRYRVSIQALMFRLQYLGYIEN